MKRLDDGIFPFRIWTWRRRLRRGWMGGCRGVELVRRVNVQMIVLVGVGFGMWDIVGLFRKVFWFL